MLLHTTISRCRTASSTLRKCRVAGVVVAIPRGNITAGVVWSQGPFSEDIERAEIIRWQSIAKARESDGKGSLEGFGPHGNEADNRTRRQNYR